MITRTRAAHEGDGRFGADGRQERSEDAVIEWVVKIAINAVALWAAIQILPAIKFPLGSEPWKLIVVALLFALINTYLKPFVKLLALPVSLVTLGLVSFLVNAAMLLVLATVSSQLKLGFVVGGYPPHLTIDTIVAAIEGSIIVSIVSTILGLLSLTRKVVGFR